MEHVACDFCGIDAATPVSVLRDPQLDLPGEFTLVRCGRCGLFYLNPRPSWAELAAHYPADYEPFAGAVARPQGGHLAAVIRWIKDYGLRRRCRAIARRRSGGRLLDVGCATGAFLDQMRRLSNWAVVGVEPIATAAQLARRHFGLEVFEGSLLDAAFPDQAFDVVTLWDVLEHVPDPQSHLAETYRILRPGGLLVVKAPDPLSWEAHLFGSYWLGHDAPRHLFGFPRSTLTSQFATVGFRPVESVYLIGGYYTFLGSLGYWAGAHGRPRIARVAWRLAHSTAARLASAPLFTLARWLGSGSSLTYFASKP